VSELGRKFPVLEMQCDSK